MIFYTGVGANKNGLHTNYEFLDIMNRELTNKDWSYELQNYPPGTHYQLQKFRNYILPDDFHKFSLEDWLDYSGASYYIQLNQL